MHLQRFHRGHQHGGVGFQARLAALDVEEFLGAEVCAKAGLGYHIIGHFEGGLCRDHRVAAMRDIGERATMDEARIIFQRLHEVRQDRVLQQRHQRAGRLDVGAGDGGAVAPVADDDAVETLLKVSSVGGQAENRHDLGGDRDVETTLHCCAIGRAAEASDHIAQVTVVHVQRAAPGHPACFETARGTPVDMIVDHGGQQVVG